MCSPSRGKIKCSLFHQALRSHTYIRPHLFINCLCFVLFDINLFGIKSTCCLGGIHRFMLSTSIFISILLTKPHRLSTSGSFYNRIHLTYWNGKSCPKTWIGPGNPWLQGRSMEFIYVFSIHNCVTAYLFWENIIFRTFLIGLVP